MKRIAFVLLFAFLLALPCAAQFTLVSATVVDPNGNPYALGTVSAQVVTAGVTPTLNGLSFSMSSGPANLDTTGSFTMSLVSSTSMVPNLNWLFTVCSSKGTVQPAGGPGPVCFTSSISVTGAAQNISTTLNALAPVISNNSAGKGFTLYGQCNGSTTAGSGTVIALNPFANIGGNLNLCSAGNNALSFWLPPVTCTLKNLRAMANTGTASPNASVNVWTSSTIGVQGTQVMSCTLPASGTPALCSDTTDTATVVAGSGLGVWMSTTSSGTTNQASDVSASVQCQ
jgi:hypothetical protein